MQQNNTRNWLKARFPKTKDFYVKTKAQLQAQYDVENVFYKFDYDASGTMECRELQEMFAENGVHLSPRDVKQLFDIVDDTKAGYLDLEKFKAFCRNKEACRMFKQLMKEVRESKMAAGPRAGHPG